MCLIITGSAQKVRATLLNTKGLLLDIFKTNPDGIGIMYAIKDELKIIKKLPKSFEKARLFIERMPCDERSVAVHFRWTTHGDTNFENCHPYTVVEGEVALMHNGVLSTGNNADRTKSDTWHFIKNYLHDSVKMAPGIVFDPGYATLVKDFIGASNRFVFMAKDGRMIILNKKEGLEHDDMWFSNTYAWTPGLLIEGYKSYQSNYYKGHYRGYGGEWGEDGEYGAYGAGWQGYQGGGQSSGTKSSGATGGASNVAHNRATLPDGSVAGRGTASSTPATASSPAPATPAANTTFTKTDAEIEEEWEKTIKRSHTDWLRNPEVRLPRGIIGGSRAPYKATGEGQDAPEEGQAVGEKHSVLDWGPPSRGEIIQATIDGDADKFEYWLENYAQITLGWLFHLYKPVPTKWVAMDQLNHSEQYIYNAFMRGDKTVLIDQIRSEANGTTVAMVICFYLDWKAWPEVRVIEEQNTAGQYPFPMSATRAKQVFNDPQPILRDESVKDTMHSDAQMGQGGATDGYAERTMSMD
jgi:hypothetical protein